MKNIFAIVKRFITLFLHKISPIIPDRIYLRCVFYLHQGHKLNLDHPKTYNEKLQWLKLYNRKPEYTSLVDKASFKEYIAKTIGEQYVIPNIGIWDNFKDIDFNALPDQFVLKCTHDSGGLIICRDKSKLDIKKAKKKINKRMRRNYFYGGREWPYKNIKPRIIAEKYMSTGEVGTDVYKLKIVDTETLQNRFGLLDHKFMCFDGEVKALFLDIGVATGSEGHAKNYYRSIYDTNWEVMNFRETRDHFPIPIERPHYFDEMIEIAKKLSKGYPHIRVDLYYINNQIYVGELTFFHGSGMGNIFIPNEWDLKLGEWIELPQ